VAGGDRLLKKVIKLAGTFRSLRYIQGLRFGAVAAFEHESVLRQLNCRTIVDVGANIGQFALVARRCYPQATILSFEPLPKPAKRYRRVFAKDERVRLNEVAVGPRTGNVTIHVSARDDSSSLLPITALQNHIFPGTSEVGQQTVRIGPLREFVRPEDIESPALLKIDVQGYELETLKGCENMLDRFAYIYVECSFVELYAGQASTSEVIDFLHERGFVLKGIYNITYDRSGLAVQADFFFGRSVG
jgi:FkbM family methyltransferase